MASIFEYGVFQNIFLPAVNLSESILRLAGIINCVVSWHYHGLCLIWVSNKIRYVGMKWMHDNSGIPDMELSQGVSDKYGRKYAGNKLLLCVGTL